MQRLDCILNVLLFTRAIDLFRDYYYYYGLAQLSSSLFAICCLLYVLQTIGYDIASIFVLMAACTQLLITCAFGQQLQNEVTVRRLRWFAFFIVSVTLCRPIPSMTPSTTRIGCE